MPSKKSNRLQVLLKNAHFKGFKSIENIKVSFEKGLNILIGRNGAGKSNLLEVLYLSTGYTKNSKLTFDFADLEFFTEDKILVKRTLQKIFRRHDLAITLEERTGVNEIFYIDNNIMYESSDDASSKKIQFKNKGVTYNSSLSYVFLRMGYDFFRPLYIKFQVPERISFLSESDNLQIELDGLFDSFEFNDSLSFLNSLLLSLVDIFDYTDGLTPRTITDQQINDFLKLPEEIIENLIAFSNIENVRFNKNINLYRDEKLLLIDNVKLEFKINNNWLPWSQISDGTKRLFYIIAEVTYNYGLILIEEPEVGIHPHQFNLLMTFLKEQSERKQIIISTHSPKALDHLTEDELKNILITQYDLIAGTQVRNMSEKEVKKAKKYMKEIGFFSDYWLLSDLEE
jgi:predicted ATP-dependent endonuclease of OLD family